LKGLVNLNIKSRGLLEHPENGPDYRALGIVLNAVPQIQNLTFSCSLSGEDDHITQVSNALTNHPNLKLVHFEQRVDTDALGSIARQLMAADSLSTIDFQPFVVGRSILPDSFFSLLGKTSMTALTIHE
jgi:hypothetical protein